MPKHAMLLVTENWFGERLVLPVRLPGAATGHNKTLYAEKTVPFPVSTSRRSCSCRIQLAAKHDPLRGPAA